MSVLAFVRICERACVYVCAHTCMRVFVCAHTCMRVFVPVIVCVCDV